MFIIKFIRLSCTLLVTFVDNPSFEEVFHPMKTKYLKSALVCSIMVVPAAYAETGNFEGFSAFISGSLVSSSLKFSQTGMNIDGFGKSSFAADIGADYGLKIGEKSVVLLGATYGLSDPKIFEISGTDSDFDGSSSFKSRWSIYAAPGVTFGPNALLYGKLAYASGKPSGDGGKTHTGFGYGAGARFALTSELFLNVEFLQQNYGKVDYDGLSASGISTYGTAALGYKF
jgi:opacity protein-like surface antigen